MPPLEDDIKEILNPILRLFDTELKTTLNGHAVTAYLKGSREMIEWGRTRLTDRPIFHEGPPVKQAIKYASDHISKAKLVDGLNVETRKQISQVISDGIKNKRGIPGIKSDLRHRFNWMARGAPSEIKGVSLASRAEMIARTETSSALSQASLDRSKDMGVTGKEWVTVGDDKVSDECSTNEAEGVIPINQTFSGGTAAPPQHPDCRCSSAPAMLPT